MEKEIFPAATDSRFIRAVSITNGCDSESKKKNKKSFNLTFYSLVYHDVVVRKLFHSSSFVPGNRFVC